MADDVEKGFDEIKTLQNEIAEGNTTETPEVSPPEVDPRDEEIARLRALVEKRNQELSDRKDAELAALREQARQLEAEDPEVYAQLANGEFVKVRVSELPGYAGTNAIHGFWVKDGKTYQIIAVHPAETEVKEEKS